MCHIDDNNNDKEAKFQKKSKVQQVVTAISRD